VSRLLDRTPAESVQQARAKHDAALQLLQQNSFTRYLHALQAGDDGTALEYGREIRATVTERAKMAGVYAPKQVDVNGTTDAVAIIDRMECRIAVVDVQTRVLLPSYLRL
jgi:hypothetical protein